ncbi:MAG: hypothetical protein M0Z54_10990 [Thermaerobacter sp.]|nr:hypothetical protein [Thermaerobacter sp.]
MGRLWPRLPPAPSVAHAFWLVVVSRTRVVNDRADLFAGVSQVMGPDGVPAPSR